MENMKLILGTVGCFSTTQIVYSCCCQHGGSDNVSMIYAQNIFVQVTVMC